MLKATPFELQAIPIGEFEINAFSLRRDLYKPSPDLSLFIGRQWRNFETLVETHSVDVVCSQKPICMVVRHLPLWQTSEVWYPLVRIFLWHRLPEVTGSEAVRCLRGISHLGSQLQSGKFPIRRESLLCLEQM